MSVRPIVFNPDGSIDVINDELNHSGTITADEIKWQSNVDGSDNYNFIVLNCPDGCGSSSTHPASGGAAPLEVQQMFANNVASKNCPCGTLVETPIDVALAHSKLHCAQMDGVDRWQVPDNAGPTINVLVNAATDYVCGLGPIDPADLPATYTTESTLTRLGIDLLDVILHNTYTRIVNGEVLVAGKPNATNSG